MTYKSNSQSKRKYHTFNYPKQTDGGKTLLTGIREVKGTNDKVYISGFYTYPDSNNVDAFVYKGDLKGHGKWNVLSYPSSPGITVTSTNLYGPNNVKNCNCQNKKNKVIRVVGNYTTQEAGTKAFGCMYEGKLNGVGKWKTLIPSFSSEPTINTIAHSTHGNLVVGNYDTQLNQGKAFIYNIKTNKYYNIVKPNAKSITAYGVWHNNANSYTICGGYSDLNFVSGVDAGYLVDYNNKTHKFSNWRTYYYNNDPKKAIVTHFDGITGDGKGGYNLTGDWLGFADGSSQLGFFAHVMNDNNNQYKRKAKWSDVSFPGKTTLTSGNSVYKNVVIGVYTMIQNESVYGYLLY